MTGYGLVVGVRDVFAVETVVLRSRSFGIGWLVESHGGETEAVRLDIETLRAMIDVALDRGAGAEDINLQACAQVLNERKRRLAELESITFYESRGS